MGGGGGHRREQREERDEERAACYGRMGGLVGTWGLGGSGGRAYGRPLLSATRPFTQESEAEGRRTQSARRGDEARAAGALAALGPTRQWHAALEPWLPPASAAAPGAGAVDPVALCALYSGT